MVGRVFVILALNSSVAVGAPIPSPSPEPLQPVSKWDLDYAETQCAAMRDYGDARNPITLGIIPSPAGDTYELKIARKRTGSGLPQEFEGSIDFGAGPAKAWLVQYGSAVGKTVIDEFHISGAEMQAARAAKNVTLKIGSSTDVVLELDSMPELMDGLQTCTADLRNFWNMDGEKNGRIVAGAKGDLRPAFSSDPYPSDAVNHEQEGDSQYLLLVDERGAIAACHVLKASGVPLLDAMGCAVMKQRTKLKPALGPSGKPVRSTLVTPPVSWKLAQ